MARYYKSPDNQILDITPTIPLEFYSKIMDTVAQNRKEAEVLAAKAKEDAYGISYIDKNARDKYVGDAEKLINSGIDQNFATAATMARMVGKAKQVLSPWQNVNAKHLAEAEREQKLRDAYGATYVGNSVKGISLINQNGKLISPDDIQLYSGDLKEADEFFKTTYGPIANKTRDELGNWHEILGGIALEQTKNTTLGLTEKEVNDLVANTDYNEMANKLPQLAKAIKESNIGNGASTNVLRERFREWAKGNLIMGNKIDSDHINNPNYGIGGGEEEIPEIPDMLSYTGTATNEEDTDFTIKDLANVRTTGETYWHTYNAPTIKNKNPNYIKDSYTAFEKMANSKFMNAYKDIWEVAKSQYPNNLKQAVDYFVNNVHKVRLNPNNKENAVFTQKKFDMNSKDTDAAFFRTMFVGNSAFEIEGSKGNKISLGKLGDKNALVTFRDDGNFIISSADDSYTLKTGDDPQALNVVPEQIKPIIQTQNKLFKLRLKSVLTQEDKQLVYTNVRARSQNGKGVGQVCYQVVESGSPNANKIIRYIINDKKEILDKRVVDFSDITQTNAFAIQQIQNTKANPKTQKTE